MAFLLFLRFHFWKSHIISLLKLRVPEAEVTFLLRFYASFLLMCDIKDVCTDAHGLAHYILNALLRPPVGLNLKLNVKS